MDFDHFVAKLIKSRLENKVQCNPGFQPVNKLKTFSRHEALFLKIICPLCGHPVKLLMPFSDWTSVQQGDRIKSKFFRSTISVLRPFSYIRLFLYFARSTSTSLLRPFVISGLLIGREVQVDVQFWSK